MLGLSKNNETTLLRDVAGGDGKAFRRLFERYWRSVYGVALAFTRSPALAEEMVQDIFLRIWLKREKLADVEKFDDYLFIVARNHIFNKLKKKLQDAPFTTYLQENISETAPSPEEQLQLRQTEQLVNKAVEQLPPQQHLIYCLSRKQGMSHEQIAHQLEISTNTVKSHMNKALHYIRHYLRTHAEI